MLNIVYRVQEYRETNFQHAEKFKEIDIIGEYSIYPVKNSHEAGELRLWKILLMINQAQR